MSWRRSVLFLVLLLGMAGCSRFLPRPGSGSGDQPVDSSSPGDTAAPEERSPFEPLENEAEMVRGEVYVNESSLLFLESYPMQVRLLVKGNLPTPCHYLRANLAKPDEKNQIAIELYSLAKSGEICVQMLQSFESSIPLGSYPDGSYTILLNGEQVGEFTQ